MVFLKIFLTAVVIVFILDLFSELLLQPRCSYWISVKTLIELSWVLYKVQSSGYVSVTVSHTDRT